MPELVVDVSLALAWGLPDESNAYADAALAAAQESGLYVPYLWSYELANGLVMAHRRQRIGADGIRSFLKALSRLQIRVATDPIISTVSDALAFAISSGLTAYDAAYVDLALREKLPLATLDKQMRQAAIISGVMVFE